MTPSDLAPKSSSGLWDRIGIWLSGLCVLHCLLMPVLLAVLPLWPTVFEVDAWFHPLSAFLLVPPTLIAMRSVYRKNLGLRLMLAFVVGLILVFAAWLLHDWVGFAGETVLTLVGSSLLIVGHWRNWRG